MVPGISAYNAASTAVATHYAMQRERYGEAFTAMGLTLYTGDGGFYHWLELPEGLNASDFNTRLFKRGAAILEAKDCDMARPHAKDPDYVTPYRLTKWYSTTKSLN